MNSTLRLLRPGTRWLCWLVLFCLLGSMSAPALRAQELAAARAGKATLEDDVEDDDSSEDDSEDDDDSGNDSDDDDDDDQDDDDDAADDDDDDRASDDLWYRVPRNDRTEFNRTLTTIATGLSLGLVGMMFGPFGFVVGGLLGSGLGVLLSRELWPDRGSDDWDRNSLSDPYYDRNYAGGGNTWSGRATGFSSAPDTPLRELEQTYFEAMDEYRAALRGSDFERTNEARQAYQTAYEALVKGKYTAGQ